MNSKSHHSVTVFMATIVVGLVVILCLTLILLSPRLLPIESPVNSKFPTSVQNNVLDANAMKHGYSMNPTTWPKENGTTSDSKLVE